MIYVPIIFEHPDYGTLVVANMLDDEGAMTNDTELATVVVCPLPDGRWLTACASEGRFTRIQRLH